MQNLSSINAHAQHFFETYQHNYYHSAFTYKHPLKFIIPNLSNSYLTILNLISSILPITSGFIHFLPKVETDGYVSILNHRSLVSTERVQSGVWATLQLITTQSDGILTIYDAPPDTPHRQRLAQHSFPLPQRVVLLQPIFTRPVPQSFQLSLLDRFNIFRRNAFTMS